MCSLPTPTLGERKLSWKLQVTAILTISATNEKQTQQQQHLLKHDKKNYSRANVVVYLKVKSSLQVNKTLKI